MTSSIHDLARWECNYLWGFVGGDPYKLCTDPATIHAILQHAEGPRAFIAPNATFHPYQLVNEKRFPVWDLLYVLSSLDPAEPCLNEAAKNVRSTVIPAQQLGLDKLLVWPDDRLDPLKHPEFRKMVPFVLPYLSYRNTEAPHWDRQIRAEMKTNGHAQAYMDQFNQLLSKFLEGHVFMVGFGEFSREDPFQIVDQFVRFQQQMSKAS